LTRAPALVIACDKREAFAQESTCDEAIQFSLRKEKWIASLALAMTVGLR
jgi:hypothetical protein